MQTTSKRIPCGAAAAALLLASALPFAARAQEKKLALDTTAGLALHNANAAPVSFQGRKALKLTRAGEAPAGGEAARLDHLAIVEGLDFSNGTIEVDLAGEPGSGAAGGARGFVGVAFRLQPDRKTYDCFYLRPTNGRVDDQERRNHTAQYISHPNFPWFKLRQETPSKYEAWADIGPAEWIHVKIEVQGEKARLYVGNGRQPVLIVNDVKTGAAGKGKVALWFEGSTVAHFANLSVAAR